MSIHHPDRPTLSYEFFPPKDDSGDALLWSSFDALLKTSPDFVSVTYGAGGTNQARSISVVERMAQNVATVGHLTAVGATRAKTLDLLRDFEAAGVAGILALRGDSPKDNPDALAQGEIKTALELVELSEANTGLDIGVAAFPEIHPESPDLAHDIRVLKLKQDAGATFAITQLFFDLDAYARFVSAAREAGVTIPIIPGLMPISNAKQVLRMADLSGASIPPRLLNDLQTAQDDQSARRVGMAFSVEFGRRLLAEAAAPGLHIFSLNSHIAALELATGVGLA
ncbi:MAG: hypothetical protein RLZZ626_43 [Actinomycetota bacterium]